LNQVLETVLLLVIVIVFTSLAMAARCWADSPLNDLTLYGAPMVAGLACGRITRIVRRATA
jgi:hypothetical protein